jgi:hypothetical protein
VALRLNPGFCPAVTKEDQERTRRLILQRSVLLDAIQNWPPDTSRILPPSSLLLYRPTDALPAVFMLDPGTNQIAKMPLDPAMYPNLVNIYIAGAVVPLLVATVISGLVVWFLAKLMQQRRQEIIDDARDQEAIYVEFREMRLQKRGGRPTLEQERKDRAMLDPKRADINHARQHSSFYHIVHQLINPGYQAKDLIFRLLEATELLALGTLPSWYIRKVAAELQLSYLTEKCSLRLDKCVCMREEVLYAELLEGFAYTQMLIAFAELVSYYLSMPYLGGTHALKLPFDKVILIELSPFYYLRHLFMAVYLVATLATLFLLALNGIWLIVASLIDPVKVAPYAVSMAGVLTAGARFAARLDYVRVRVSKNVRKALDAPTSYLRKEAMERFPPSLLQLLMTKNLNAAFTECDLSHFKLVVRVLTYMGILVISQVRCVCVCVCV